MKDLTSYVYNFEELIQGNFLYVDKTEYIWQLVRPSSAGYFLSRPRRFGKSLTLSTLKAVFEGKKELFKGLAIYEKAYDWKPYPVIHLSFGDYGVGSDAAKELSGYLMAKVKEIAESYSIRLSNETPGLCLGELIDKLYTKGSVVILVDEYDKPILDNISNPEVSMIQKQLKGFFGVLKERNAKERFLFVTGVSKFCHVSLFSDLNNLTDISMDSRYAAMLGYTQEELESYFGDRIAALAGEQGIDSFKAEIKSWYNGYRFHEDAETVYNPVSLAQFFEKNGKFNNYWFATGTPSFLMELTRKTEFDFRSVIGGDSVPEIAFSAFEIDNIDPLTLLLQTGYLTIKGTEQKFGQTWYFLDFPNKEVTTAFSAYILNSYAAKTQTVGVRFVAEFATSLLNNDLKKLRKALEIFFAGIPYDVHKKQESTFQGIFFSLFRLLGEYVEAESSTNDGRIDAVVQTPKAVYIFEFKLDNDPTALEQIKEKEYFRKYQLDKREIYIVGVNFDSVKGNLVGWEEEKVDKR